MLEIKTILSFKSRDHVESKYLIRNEFYLFLVRCLCNWPRNRSCQYQRSLNSVNIYFKGIHALGHLFSVIFHEKRDQNEISRQTLNFQLSMEPILVMPLHFEVQHQCRLLLHRISLTHGVHKHPDRYQRTVKHLIP